MAKDEETDPRKVGGTGLVKRVQRVEWNPPLTRGTLRLLVYITYFEENVVTTRAKDKDLFGIL